MMVLNQSIQLYLLLRLEITCKQKRNIHEQEKKHRHTDLLY